MDDIGNNKEDSMGKIKRLIQQDASLAHVQSSHEFTDSRMDMQGIALSNITLPERDTNGSSREDEYRPREHRQPRLPINLWVAYFNFFKGTFSSGILGMPFAISECGITIGIMFILLMGLINAHCLHILFDSLDEICKRLKVPHITFRNGFRMALHHGPKVFRKISCGSKVVITIFTFCSQLCICCVFIIFSAENLNHLFNLNEIRYTLCVIAVPCIILVTFMRDLTIIGMVSLVGIILAFLGLGILMYFFLFIVECQNCSIKHAPDGNLESIFHSIHLSFVTIIYSLISVSTVLSIDKALPQPSVMVRRYGIINIGILLTTLSSIIFGVSAYLNNGTIPNNLLIDIPHELVNKVANVAYCISILITLPLHSFPAVEIMLEVYKSTVSNVYPLYTNKYKLMSFIFRPIFITICFILSAIIAVQPPLEGAVAIFWSHLTIIFPVLMEICLLYPGPYGKYSVLLIKNLMLLILALIVIGLSLLTITHDI